MLKPTGTLIEVNRSARTVSSFQWMAVHGTVMMDDFRRPEMAMRTLHSMKLGEAVRFLVQEITYDMLVPLVEGFYVQRKRKFEKRVERGQLIVTRVL